MMNIKSGLYGSKRDKSLAIKKMMAMLADKGLTPEKVFDVADLNNDGVLDAQEIGQVFSHLKVADIDSIIEVFKDGYQQKLTREQFSNIFLWRDQEMLKNKIKDIDINLEELNSEMPVLEKHL